MNSEKETNYFLPLQLSIVSIQQSTSTSISSSSNMKLVPESECNYIQHPDKMLKQQQESIPLSWITSIKRFHPPSLSSSKTTSGSSKFLSYVAPSICDSSLSSHFKLFDSLRFLNRHNRHNYHHHPHLRNSNNKIIVSKILLFLMSIFLLRHTTTTIRFTSLSLLIMMAKCDQSTNNAGGSSASSSNTIPSALPLVNFRCPDQFGYYADEYNCSKYYVCVFGEALHESCTGGLRFSSELQTCDWPRNVVCPFEDSDYADETEDEYPNDPNDLTRSKHSHRNNQQVNQHNDNQHHQQVGSGMIIETSTSRTTINPPMIVTPTTAKPLIVGGGGGGGGYVGDNPFVAIHKTPTQTQTDPLVYRTHNGNNNNNKVHEEEHAAILIHDSFDKLIKPNLGRQPVPQPKTSNQPANHYDPIQPNQVLVPNNYLDEALIDFNGQSGNRSTILNYNQQRNNRNRIGHQRNYPRPHHIHHQNSNPSPNHVDDDSGASLSDLDENFTLVDLQRSRTATGSSSGAGNILGTIGRSVNGENNNRAQSVSVVASTSSKAIIPELDFVFKNHNPSLGDKHPPTLQPSNQQSNIKHLEQNPNQLLIDEIIQLTQALNQENSKFDDVITAIVDENGAIHLAGGTDSPALLRLLAASGPSKPTTSVSSNPNQPQQEGLAASNRNLASQQLITVNGGNGIDNNSGNFSADKYKYQTTTSHQGGLIKSQLKPPPSSSLEPEIEFKTLEPGAILVYNKTQLIVVPETKPSSSGVANHYNSSVATFGTISSSHNGSSGSVRSSLEYLTDFASSSVDSNNSNKPRQLNTRTDKESSYLFNQADLHNQKSNVNNRSSTPSIHPRINNPKPQPSTTPTNVFSTISSLSLDGGVDDEIEDLDDGFSLMMKPGAIGSGMMQDFQRIGPPPRPSSGEVNNRTQAPDSDVHKRRIPEYRQIPSLVRSNQNLTINTTQQHSGSGSSSNHIPRPSQVRHLGSHHRNTQSKSAAITTAPSNTNSTSSSQTTRLSKNLQMPQRPPSMYKTPEPLSTATKCSEQACKLPDCFCGGIDIPGNLPVKDVPQLVLISFDDAVNDINWHIYEELLNSGRSNPNGCPIKSTFYVSHEWTDYSQVQTLYSRGHEIASHSITHSFGESYDKQQWYKEIVGQREILHLYGGVNKVDIRGMRAPFLQGGGNKQFEMLHEENFTYDSSMPVFENSPPFWPYTLDYSINHECMIAPCPTKSFPGLWEIGLVMWQDLHGGRCSMGDACSNPSDEKGVYELIMKNFKRHYNSNRAPFGLYYHSAWFNSEHHRTGFIRVIDDLLTYYKDVYFVTKWELIQWIRNPTPLKELYRVNLFGCARDPHRPPPCLHPNICNVGSNSGARFLKTCQPCPKRYPWLDDTGQ